MDRYPTFEYPKTGRINNSRQWYKTTIIIIIIIIIMRRRKLKLRNSVRLLIFLYISKSYAVRSQSRMYN